VQAAPVVEQVKPEPVREPVVPAPVTAQPVKAEAAVVAEPVAVPEPVVVKEPEVVKTVKAAPEPARKVTNKETKPAAKGAAKVVAKPEASPPAKPAKPAEPSRPFPNLGKAVVMPPPGYDPSNPMAYRRKQEAASAKTAAAAAAAAAPSRGRRRVEHGAAARPADRGRRGRRQQGHGGRGGFQRPGRGRRRKSSGIKAASPAPKAQKRKVKVDNVISVGQLAHSLGVKASLVIRQLMDMGVMANITEMLDIDTASVVASEFDYEVENVGFQEHNYLQHVGETEEEEELDSRPPVVTIMGHVDHGKTTLLDAIRSARVAAGEAGGITQHIGAYQVEVRDQVITFLDTPGHQAFTAMRARGAEVTDIVILVVAADDGVQPQTEEAIAHAKAAGVPLVVAVNKMDKAGVTADNIKQRLSDHGLVPEEWGGETIYVPVSALKGEGIDDLLESLVLQSEMLELVASCDRHAEGTVIEAKMERGRGAVATVLIQKGTLNRGDHVVLGSAFGKVRAMVDYRGKRIKVAGPSTPVELFGLSELPEVGDSMNVVTSEKNARKLADHRAVAKRQAAMAKTRRRTAEDLFAAAAEAQRKKLNVILKADVQGTLQALKGALENLEVEGADVRFLHTAVGDISESDVTLAAANGALLFGFNTNVDARARRSAQDQGVRPELFKVIYDVIDRVERDLKGLLEPEYELVRQGAVEVRVIFKISRVGTVAGSYVTDGKIGRHSIVRLIRGGREIWEGKVSTLKRFKDDVKEVSNGYECGVALDGYNELVEGDVIEAYTREIVVQD
jgi:translation initiation factor IF-2